MDNDELYKKMYMQGGGDDKEQPSQPEPDHKDYERHDDAVEPLIESDPSPDSIEPETGWDRE